MKSTTCRYIDFHGDVCGRRAAWRGGRCIDHSLAPTVWIPLSGREVLTVDDRGVPVSRIIAS